MPYHIVPNGATPVWSVNAPTAFSVYDNRSVALFFIATKRNYMVMSKPRENCIGTKYSNAKTRHTHETDELLSLKQQLEAYKRLFEIEKNCKNQAYFFVLSCRHFEEYREYCKTHPTNIDYHSACVDMFRMQLLKDKQNGK